MRILLVTPVPAFFPRSGASQRSALLRLALQTVGDVDVLQLEPGVRTQVERVDDRGTSWVHAKVAWSNWTPWRFWSKAGLTLQIENVLGRKLSEYQLVVGRYLWPLCQLSLPPGMRVIADLDDFHFRFSPLQPWSWTMLKHRVKKPIDEALARRQLHRLDAAFVASASDLARMGGLECRLLSNIVFDPAGAPAPFKSAPKGAQKTPTVLFLGSLWYYPNAEAVSWFLDRVWPSILSQFPQATLLLAGSASAQQRQKWRTLPSVEAPGFVEDLARVYARADLVVAPVLCGGGSNIKLVEAMQHGHACLVTQTVADGFSTWLKPGENVLVAKSAEEFAARAIGALQNPQYLGEIGQTAKKAVSSAVGHERFKQVVHDLVASVMNRKTNVT